MLFASDSFCGQAVLFFIVIFWGIAHLIGKAAENPVVREAAEEGFWSWFFSDE
jgi:hypothetical protein